MARTVHFVVVCDECGWRTMSPDISAFIALAALDFVTQGELGPCPNCHGQKPIDPGHAAASDRALYAGPRQ